MDMRTRTEKQPLRSAAERSGDGRRKRSQVSRQTIIEAMLALVLEGHITPGAEQVAARAGMGLRSVFRHFADMDSLYAEICARIQAGVETVARQPFVAQDWRGQVLELIGRRAIGFEMIAPFQRAAQVHRHRSPVLQESHRVLTATLRQILLSRLPPEVAKDRVLVETLDLALGFETWQRLREQQRLGVRESCEVLDQLVRRVLASVAETP